MGVKCRMHQKYPVFNEIHPSCFIKETFYNKETRKIVLYYKIKRGSFIIAKCLSAMEKYVITFLYLIFLIIFVWLWDCRMGRKRQMITNRLIFLNMVLPVRL